MLHNLRQKARPPSSWSSPSPRISSLVRLCVLQTPTAHSASEQDQQLLRYKQKKLKTRDFCNTTIGKLLSSVLPNTHFSPHQSTADLDVPRFINQIHQIIKLACKQWHLEFINGWMQKEKKNALNGLSSSWDKRLYKGSTRGTLRWSDHFSCQVLTLFLLYRQ